MTSARTRRSSLAHQSLSASLRTTDTILTTMTAPKRVSFLGFLQLATAKGPGRILTQNTPKHAVPLKDVPFRGREHKI